MVKSLWKFINKEISGLHQAAYLLGAFAILSTILALVRDRLLAYTFGASHTLDLYYAAFRIPDFIFVSIGSLVSISVLIPFFMEKIDRSPEDAKEFIQNTFSIFFFTIMFVAVAAFFAAPFIISILFPDFAADKGTLIMMTRIILLSPIFLGFSNFLASITQIYKRFFVYALSPVLYNLGIIIGTIFFYPIFGIAGLAWGVGLGAFMHCFIQVPFILEKKLFPRLTWHIKFASIKRVVLLSLPRTITISSNEICELFLISFASFLTGGSISVFTFAFNLQSVPLSIIGVNYALAAFPTLTRYFNQGEPKKFVEHMIVCSQHIIFWSLPATFLFVVLRAQVVRVILGSGQFGWADTRLTAAAMALFVISLIPQSLVVLFVRAYYSRGHTLVPLVINGICSVFIIGLALGLVKLFSVSLAFHTFIDSILRVSGIPGTNVLMLPLAFSIGTTINLISHWIAFHGEFPDYSRPVLRSLGQVFLASVLMGVVSYFSLEVLANFLNLNKVVGIFLQGFIAGILGIAVGIFALVIMHNNELKQIWKTLHKKIWKAEVIGPDPNVV